MAAFKLLPGIPEEASSLWCASYCYPWRTLGRQRGGIIPLVIL